MLVTDLGLLAKQSTDGSRDVFVQSIATGEPVAGVTVDVVAKNGSTLFSQITDAAGRVHFDKLEGLVRERAPLLLLARKGGDMSFLPLNRGDRQIDYPCALRRGRAAERAFAGPAQRLSLLRPWHLPPRRDDAHGRDREERRLGPAPVRRALAGRGAGRARPGRQARAGARRGAGGFLELSHTTQDTSPTGNYTVNLNILKGDQVLRQIGSTTVRFRSSCPTA